LCFIPGIAAPPQLRKKHALATVSLIALALIALPGCGSGGNDSTRSNVPSLPQAHDLRAMVLTSEEVNRFPADSPARALYSWWRAVQFRDIPSAKQAYANGVDVGDLEHQVVSLNPPLSASRPSIVDTVQTDKAAKLYVIVQTLPLQASGQVRGGGTRAVEIPVVFRLVKQGDTWKLADNSYIDQRIRSQEAAANAARPQAGT
jgi:hypothetical protein